MWDNQELPASTRHQGNPGWFGCCHKVKVVRLDSLNHCPLSEPWLRKSAVHHVGLSCLTLGEVAAVGKSEREGMGQGGDGDVTTTEGQQEGKAAA